MVFAGHSVNTETPGIQAAAGSPGANLVLFPPQEPNEAFKAFNCLILCTHRTCLSVFEHCKQANYPLDFGKVFLGPVRAQHPSGSIYNSRDVAVSILIGLSIQALISPGRIPTTGNMERKKA